MSWGILGGGFGLYGYLPALASERLSEKVATLEKYRDFIRSRRDISGFEHQICFVENIEDLLATSDHLIIAQRPADQTRALEMIVASKWRGSLLLEKPLARNPLEASQVLDRLESAQLPFLIGYSVLETEWARTVRNLFSNSEPNEIEITWRFAAHHYKQQVDNWKRYPIEGGGALRFFCIHLIALLADIRTWRTKTCSPWLIGGEDPSILLELGDGGCHAKIECDSNWNFSPIFSISVRQDSRRLLEFTNSDPFDKLTNNSVQDRRVAYLKVLIKRLIEMKSKPLETYKKQISLWRDIENLRGADVHIAKN